MKKILLLIALIFIQVAGATDRLNISADVQSYSEIPSDEIYVGSLIYYNITIFNPNDYEIKRNFNIYIIDEQEKVIHYLVKESFIIEPKKTKNLVPYKDGNSTDYWLISPLKAGTYLLEVSTSGEPIEFFENKTIEVQISPNQKMLKNFYRYEINSIKFPFAVTSLYEKRLKGINQEQFNKNIELNQKMLTLNEEMLNLNKEMRDSNEQMLNLNTEMRDRTDTMTILTWIMLFVSIITLIKRPK
ncbi:MAG: hypothetical protein O8C64_01730 [Candidatus Methanoperedens sp.]|nr:hypothetical protein [Candidatus Methanoperedens sp.]MCZ7405250.1 hypothetical protein [Candidatus Methanoperedens sp.]